jgi:hypothetical protein
MEKGTGLDLDGDGDVGVVGVEGQQLLQWVESSTGTQYCGDNPALPILKLFGSVSVRCSRCQGSRRAAQRISGWRCVLRATVTSFSVGLTECDIITTMTGMFQPQISPY